jgi:hypothetical protein
MSDRPKPYRGPVGPEAMSALTDEFKAAYSKASGNVLAAVLEFERITGRIVTDVDLARIDITQVGDEQRQFIREAAINFLPTPGEVAW